MRKSRTEIEEYFCDHLTRFFRENFDAKASPDESKTDRPDYVVIVNGRKIAIELSQIPSSYVIRHFHKIIPPPTFKKNEIRGRMVVFPFEPHYWVHEVVARKGKSAKRFKNQVGADEIWLALHSHSIKRDWPMSNAGNLHSRRFDIEMMKFGTKGHLGGFDRLLFVYADGTVAGLLGHGEIAPKRIEMFDEDGYPAATLFSFSFAFDVPLNGLGQRIYEFKDVTFSESVVAPKDDWMRDRHPNIKRPHFSARATVESQRMYVEIFRDGKRILLENLEPGPNWERTMKFVFSLEWGIERQRYRVLLD